MKYITFRTQIRLPIFTSQNLLNLGIALHPGELTRWIKKGYIQKMRGGLYAFTDSLSSLLPQNIATTLYNPSYLSLEYALSHFGIIPEAVHTYTSVTSRTPRNYQLALGTFTYRHLSPRLFFGYPHVSTTSLPYLLAEPEKALLDYLHLTPNIKSQLDVKELRLNLENIDWPKFTKYQNFYSNKRVIKLAKIIKELYADS